MKVSRWLLFYLLVVVCTPCRNDARKDDLDKSQTYSNEFLLKEKEVIDFLSEKGSSELNDTAKWYLYNIYCDDTIPKRITKNTGQIYFAYLDLKPIAYEISSDSLSLDIAYLFLYNDTIRVQGINTKYGSVVSGVSFYLNDNKIRGFITGRGSYGMVLGDSSRFLKPLQPEIHTFVRIHWDNINEWYKKALMNHGLGL